MKPENAVQIGTLSSEQLKQLELAGIIPKGTPEAQVQIFAQICKEKSLSPFQKQIYLLPFKKKAQDGTYETHYACIIGIDGYRTIAERTGCYAGNDDYRFDNGMSEFEIRASGKKNPITATATVYKLVTGQRVGFSASVSWESYYPGGAKAYNWDKMPFLMLGKTAEALALRKAFPGALSGLHSEEEKGGFEETKDPQKIADEEKSEQAFVTACLLIDDFTDAKEFQGKYKSILADCVEAGLLKKDEKKLVDYINAKNHKLIADAKAGIPPK